MNVHFHSDDVFVVCVWWTCGGHVPRVSHLVARMVSKEVTKLPTLEYISHRQKMTFSNLKLKGQVHASELLFRNTLHYGDWIRPPSFFSRIESCIPPPLDPTRSSHPPVSTVSGYTHPHSHPHIRPDSNHMSSP